MMTELPKVRSRNMSELMQAVIDTHQQIRAGIEEHAAEVEALRAARNASLNANAKVGYKPGKAQ